METKKKRIRHKTPTGRTVAQAWAAFAEAEKLKAENDALKKELGQMNTAYNYLVVESKEEKDAFAEKITRYMQLLDQLREDNKTEFEYLERITNRTWIKLGRFLGLC